MFEPWLIVCPECRKNVIHIPGIDAHKRSCIFCGASIVRPGEGGTPSFRPQAA